MAAVSALRDNVEILPIGSTSEGAETVNPTLIHVRFQPDGSIGHITDRPAHLSDDQWFKLLCSAIGHKYHARAGGRGFFRTTRDEIQSIGAAQV